jgi:hypothetical protein
LKDPAFNWKIRNALYALLLCCGLFQVGYGCYGKLQIKSSQSGIVRTLRLDNENREQFARYMRTRSADWNPIIASGGCVCLLTLVLMGIKRLNRA